MRNQYQDMRTGMIALAGIRTITKADRDNIYEPKKGAFSISIQYKGISSIVFNYVDNNIRDIVYEELKQNLIPSK